MNAQQLITALEEFAGHTEVVIYDGNMYYGLIVTERSERMTPIVTLDITDRPDDED